jgi:hypothetical protein
MLGLVDYLLLLVHVNGELTLLHLDTFHELGVSAGDYGTGHPTLELTASVASGLRTRSYGDALNRKKRLPHPFEPLSKKAPELAEENAYLTLLSHLIPRRSAQKREVGVSFGEKAIFFLQSAQKREVGVLFGEKSVLFLQNAHRSEV